MKQTKSTKVTNVFYELHNKEFGRVRVVRDTKGGGYVNLYDLCHILELSVKEVLPKLHSHLFTVTTEDTKGEQLTMTFVDEYGLYLVYLLSKWENTICFQDWLFKLFLQPLHEQQKQNMDAKTANDLQAVRYLAIADNVRKSGHFKEGKPIPELTLSHLIGWWHNLNDQSMFMLQFNCKSCCFVSENIRMNVYLRKMVDGRIDDCSMHISFLDLDDDSHEFLVIDTIIPSSVILDGTILDYIMADQFIDEDILEPKNVDLVIILNGTMSFHRSRRLEKKEQPLLEFV